MVVGCCAGAVGVCIAWGIPEYNDWYKLGLPDSNSGNLPSSCGEGNGVFNTACPNYPSYSR